MRNYQHTAFPVLDRYDIFTVATKATPASIFRLIWIWLLHSVVKRVRNRTSRFRCDLDSADGYGVLKNWVSLG